MLFLNTSKKITLQNWCKIGIIISSKEMRGIGPTMGSMVSCLRSETTGATEWKVPVMTSKFWISKTVTPQGGLFYLYMLMLLKICVE